MKQITTIVAGALFFVWILPLGAFIKPKDEEKACNGKRAICLCSHLIAKQQAKTAGKTFLKVNTGAQETTGNSPSFGPDFTLTAITLRIQLPRTRFSQFALIHREFSYIRPIEHVPKD